MLIQDYEALGEHYTTAIMPAGVRKPKPIVENYVRFLETYLVEDSSFCIVECDVLGNKYFDDIGKCKKREKTNRTGIASYHFLFASYRLWSRDTGRTYSNAI